MLSLDMVLALGGTLGAVGAVGRSPGDPESFFAILNELGPSLCTSFCVPRVGLCYFSVEIVSRTFCVLIFVRGFQNRGLRKEDVF